MAKWMLGILYSMHSRPNLIFLTLVLCFELAAHGAPPSDLSDPPPPPNEEGKPIDEVNPDVIESNNLSITPVEMSEAEKKEISYVYPYLQSISPRIILIADLDAIREGESVPYGLGVTYLAPRKRQPQWEGGADLFSNSDGHLHLGLRWVHFSDNYFRPYYKAGIAHVWKADEKLASFSNWKNYYLKGAVGFEDVIKPPMSARLEMELAVGTEEMLIMFSLGYSWGF
ncbi:MAG: hypothetical protein H6624_10480 [Bdellovibrionaceae bacterium]|nr:hypothetical protein [Bdellovibrionales bacterium]MCB9084761.1 hypothetical protein [Pseudobdellovibrionaceae bacterium]